MKTDYKHYLLSPDRPGSPTIRVGQKPGFSEKPGFLNYHHAIALSIACMGRAHGARARREKIDLFSVRIN
ncbi:MAG: hypothetical protein AB4352_07960 [Hormoscilla sp.]